MTDIVQLEVNMGGSQPIRSRSYRISPNHKDMVLDRLVIVPSTSPWAPPLPIVAVQYQMGIRVRIDFRTSNKVTKKDPYEMPLIEKILNQPSEASSC